MDNRKEAKDTYTATEVGTLIESFRGDVSIIAEKVGELSNRMERVENRLEKVEERLTGVEDAVKVAIPDLYRKVATIEAKC